MATLTGTETLLVLGQDQAGRPAAEQEQVTTGQIGALGGAFSNAAPVTITSAGGTTITASQFITGPIFRSGTSAAFNDTTDTAANIYAATGGLGSYVYYKNISTYAGTLLGGTGIAMTSFNTINPSTTTLFLAVFSSATSGFFHYVNSGFNTTNRGTVTIAGTSSITVSNTRVTSTSVIQFTLNSVGGTVGAYPTIKTFTPGTGFTVTGTASDTSTYNYLVME